MTNLPDPTNPASAHRYIPNSTEDIPEMLRTIGVVTSGTHSPTLKKPIGLAYLPPGKSALGTEFTVLIRGKETRARVVPTPFYKRAK